MSERVGWVDADGTVHSAPLRAVTTTERRCVAQRVTWPTFQCELIAGHDGPHVAHGDTRLELITWHTGRER